MISAEQARTEYMQNLNKWLCDFEEKYKKTLDEIDEQIRKANQKIRIRQCEYVYNDWDTTYFPDVHDLIRYLEEKGYFVKRLKEERRHDSKEHLKISWGLTGIYEEENDD